MVCSTHPSRRGRVHALVLCLAVTISAIAPSSAEAQVEEEFQLWSALLASGAFQPETPRVAFWFDIHARRGDSGTVLILRPGVGAEITDWLSVWAGYAWVPVFTDGAGSRNEHRFWQQVILKHSTDHWAFQSRTRFELRFAEGGDDVGFRLRQFVRANWTPRTGGELGVAVWDEIFLGFNDTDWGAAAGFDQNRLFVGPFLNISSWARLEAGYLFVYLKRQPVNRIAHTLAINLFVSLRH